MISLQMVPTQICMVGGLTNSIFEKSEALLLESSDHQHALEYVAGRKNAYRYQSVMDFLFCELNPEWRNSCFNFYKGSEKPLRDILTIEQIMQYDNYLCTALEVAYSLFCEKRRQSWAWYREQVEEAIKLAA